MKLKTIDKMADSRTQSKIQLFINYLNQNNPDL